MKKQIFMAASLLFALAACNPEDPAEDTGNLQFLLRFDPNQERLNNFGEAATMPVGHAAQTPDFQEISIHYIELAASANTPLGLGVIVYKGAETDAGGATAVDFEKAISVGSDAVFATFSLENLPLGTYEWVRASVTYQNYDVIFNLKNVPVVGNLDGQKGTVASFVGFNTFLKQVTPRSKSLAVNDDKKQGFWAFETNLTAPFGGYDQLFSGEAPAGGTTVVNPLFQSSPIPQGSCVITGKFLQPLVITGRESKDITTTLSFSINQSFEWEDPNGNGQWDIDANDLTKTEKVVDMGLRGLKPEWKN